MRFYCYNLLTEPGRRNKADQWSWERSVIKEIESVGLWYGLKLDPEHIKDQNGGI